MSPPFGIFRHLERRKSNLLHEGNSLVYTPYEVMVVRFVFLWIPIWTMERSV